MLEMDFVVDAKPITAVYRIPSKPYARVLDSIEHHGKSRPTYTEWRKGEPHDKKILGLPDVWRINPLVQQGKPAGVQMTPEFQFWIYYINVQRQYGRMTSPQLIDFYRAELDAWKRKTGGQTIKDFNSLFRSKASHVNYAGVDKYENALTGANKGVGWPIFSNIVTGGWVGELKRWDSNQFRVINASKGFAHFNPWDNPELFDEPLNTGREFIGDTSVIKRDDLRKSYDDFGGKVVLPVMLPLDDWGVFPDADYLVPSDKEPLRKFA